MATLALEHVDCFTAHSTPLLQGSYTVANGNIINEPLATSPFFGGQVLEAGSGVYKAFDSGPTSYVMSGIKGYLTSLVFINLLAAHNAALGGLVFILVLPGGGYAELHYGGAVLATSATPLFGINTTFTLECAARLTSTGSIEVRKDGLRIPEFCTTDWTAAGGQPAGLLTPPNLSGNGQAVAVNFTPNGAVRCGYLWQKVGTSLWTSIATGTATYAQLSDFYGDAIRGTSRTAGNGATYPIGGSDWSFGGSGAPATVAAALGETLVDSDVGYATNSTFPQSGADKAKFSLDYANAPGAASIILAAQRNIVARGANTGSPSQLRTYLRSGGVNYQDATDINLVNGQYRIFHRPYSTTPYAGTPIWTPTNLNAVEGITELVALVP